MRFEFLKTNKEVAFATVEGCKPKLRVFQIMKQNGHTLYFVTAPGKEVYRQLQDNPNVEILAMKDNVSVRLAASSLDYFDLTPTPPVFEHHQKHLREKSRKV